MGVRGGGGVESEVGKGSKREEREEEELRARHGGSTVLYFGKEYFGFPVEFAVYRQRLDGEGV